MQLHLTALQIEMIELLASVGTMDAEDIQTRVCCASGRRFEAALQGLKQQGVVIYRGAAADGCWRLTHNPLANGVEVLIIKEAEMRIRVRYRRGQPPKFYHTDGRRYVPGKKVAS